MEYDVRYVNPMKTDDVRDLCQSTRCRSEGGWPICNGEQSCSRMAIQCDTIKLICKTCPL